MIVTKAAVVGAGVMGAGIARHMESHGVEVTLIDNNTEQLARAIEINKGHKIRYADHFKTIDSVDYAIEAVYEDLNVKRQTFIEISSSVSKDCIIASNTSSLLISDLAESVKNPYRFLGVHYNNPADLNPIVEVIPSNQTTEHCTQVALGWLLTAGKRPVKCKDTPCFILNRQSLPYINEAARCISIATPSEIDYVARNRLGLELGPFEVMNLVGLSVMAAASQNLQVLGTGYMAAEQLQQKAKHDEPNWNLEKEIHVSQVKTSAIVKRLRGAMIFPGKDILEKSLCSRDDLHMICKEALGYDKSSPELLEMFEPGVTNSLLTHYLSNQQETC